MLIIQSNKIYGINFCHPVVEVRGEKGDSREKVENDLHHEKSLYAHVDVPAPDCSLTAETGRHGAIRGWGAG